MKFSWDLCNVPNRGCVMILILIPVIDSELPTFSEWVLSSKQSERTVCAVANSHIQ